MKKIIGYILIYIAVVFELLIVVYFSTQSGRAAQELGRSSDETGFWVGTILAFVLMTAPVVLLFWIGRRMVR